MAETQTIDHKSLDGSYQPIPLETLIEYRSKGLSYKQIGKLVGRSKQTIHQRLQPVIAELNALPDYKRHKADILALTGNRILSSLTPAKLKDSSAYQLTGMFGIINQHERLEREQSTANISIRMATIAALQREIEGE